MYKAFYGFTTYPFALTLSPQCLFLSENSQNCLFYLLRGLEQDYDILVVAGAVGTGKTSTLHIILKILNEKMYTAFLVRAKFDSVDILQYVSQKFDLETTGKSKYELLLNLKRFLSMPAMSHEKVLLIIDEAQNIPVDVLEDLSLITKFQNSEKRSLQIILFGQLQLEDTLKLAEIAKLSPRVRLVYRLLPMNYNETKIYIEKRLSVSGVKHSIITPKSIKEIFVYSQGIPRAINIICDLAFVFGFIDQARQIGHSIIKRVMKELSLYAPEDIVQRHTSQERDTNKKVVEGSTDRQRKRQSSLLCWGVLCAAALLLSTSLPAEASAPEPLHKRSHSAAQKTA